MKTLAIQKSIDAINKRLSEIPEKDVALLEKTATAEGLELATYQGVQSRAFAAGKISLENAQWLYNIFGREMAMPESFNKKPLADRIAALNAIVSIM